MNPSASALLLTVLAVGGLSACSSGPDEPTAATPDSDSKTQSQSAPPPAMTGDPRRDAIISTFANEDEALVELASNSDTTIAQVPASALPQWELLDLSLDSPRGSRDSTVAINPDGRVVVLTSNPENFATIAKDAEITTAAQAVELVQAFVATTSDVGQINYPISSVNDIKYYPDLDVDELALRTKIARDHSNEITAPTATADAGGWSVVTWWVNDERLVKHDIAIAADGTFTPTPTVLIKKLPVPIVG